jgi:hypothetical protein
MACDADMGTSALISSPLSSCEHASVDQSKVGYHGLPPCGAVRAFQRRWQQSGLAKKEVLCEEFLHRSRLKCQTMEGHQGKLQNGAAASNTSENQDPTGKRQSNPQVNGSTRLYISYAQESNKCRQLKHFLRCTFMKSTQ